MKILLTGCMGFIGSNLVPYLLNCGHEVLGIDNLSNPSLFPTERMKVQTAKKKWHNFEFYKVDLKNLEASHSIAVNFGPDVVIHLAALGSVPRSFSNPSATMENNVTGFSNILQIASGVGARKIVFASSSSVYGDSSEQLRTEGLEGKALSPYALSKQNNEEMARLWNIHSGLPYVGLRFFNVYGPGQLPDSPYSAVIPKFINNKKIKIYGDGSTIRDFTFVEDVCRAIELAAICKEANFVCNIGTGVGTTLKELTDIICEGEDKEVENAEERLGDVKQSIASTDLAKSKLGFEAFIDLKKGIERTKDFYKSLR